MNDVNPQAKELNDIIIAENNNIFEMLSPRGKAIYFPKKGIISQSADANGKEINATIGMALDDDGEPLILSFLKNYINLSNPSDGFTYAGSFGDINLRKNWAEQIRKKNPSINKEISLPIVTNALTHGLSIFGYLFMNINDVIISPDLYWGNYRLIFQTAYGAKIQTFETFKDNSSFNIEGFEKLISSQTSDKITILLNFPNNPTGYTPTYKEAMKINDIIIKTAEKGKKVIVVCDDAYFGLGFEEGIIKESPFAMLCQAHKNILCVKIDGPTKEDYVWGFRVGFITYGIKDGTKALYGALENKTGGAVRGNISNASNLSQNLLLQAYKNPLYDKEKESKFNILKNRYLEVTSILKENKNYFEAFEPLPFNSGYFMCIRLKNADAEEVRQILLKKYSIGLIALGKDIIRVAFSATPTKVLRKLFDGLYKAALEVSKK